LSDAETDLKKMMRDGAADEEIFLLFEQAMKNKQEKHRLNEAGPAFKERGMSQIGG
jgi:molybdenum cofactor biosynthesis enzyme MoaA